MITLKTFTGGLLDTSIGVSSCRLEDWPMQSLCSGDIVFRWLSNIHGLTADGASVFTVWTFVSAKVKNKVMLSVELHALHLHDKEDDILTFYTRVWKICEGLGFMGSTSVSHYKDSHRDGRSCRWIVERRDCHDQMILETNPNKSSCFN